jgi:hypothetical protein
MRKLLAFAVLLLVGGVPARASSGGALVVRVAQEPLPGRSRVLADVLPGATVRLSTDQSFGAGRYGLRQSIVGSLGVAVFAELPPDGYWTEVSLEGFWKRIWFVEVHSGFTRRIDVELGVEIPGCSLGEFWDFRTTLDPSISPSTYIYRVSQ